jgi:hypothetical protein
MAANMVSVSLFKISCSGVDLPAYADFACSHLFLLGQERGFHLTIRFVIGFPLVPEGAVVQVPDCVQPLDSARLQCQFFRFVFHLQAASRPVSKRVILAIFHGAVLSFTIFSETS